MAFAVYFNENNVTSNIISNSFGELTMSVPELPPGTYQVKVLNEDGLSMPYIFEILPTDASVDYEFIDSHDEQAKSRLLTMYKKEDIDPVEYANTNAVYKLIDALYVQGIQNIEEELKTFTNRYNIDLAVKYQLDQIGDIVGQTRQGMDDETYRIFIKGKIAVNNSKGREEDIITLWRIFVPATVYYYEELYPRAIAIQSNAGPSAEYATTIKNFMDKALAMGYRLAEIVVSDPTDAFLLTDNDESSYPSHGFSDEATPDIGGLLADLI